jgi:integrase
MQSATKKMGRPTAYHRTAWGENIQGLRRLKDGRWRTSYPNQITFSEPDEHVAVARFRAWESGQRRETVAVPTTSLRPGDDATRALDSLPQPHRDLRRLTGTFLPPEVLAEQTDAPAPAPITVDLDGDVLQFFREPANAAGFWPWLRRLILTRREFVAKQTGIESLAWISEKDRPEPSPTLAELIDVYAAKPGVTAEEIGRVKRFWKEFSDIVGVKTIRELTHELVERYEATINQMDLAPKSVKHRYSRIRTVIAYGLRRGKGQEDCRKALDALAMLESAESDNLDPNPIAPADFWAIHQAALDAGDTTFAAMMLFALNAAQYPSEVGSVRCAEVDLERREFSTRRNKTKVPRVAVLWPETIKAIKTLPRDREQIFCTRIQAYNRMSIFRDWKKYREAAGVKDGVTFAQIRDAAFTEACRKNLDQARVLSGHRLPGAVDNYVLRQPNFVADVCEAIRDHFYSAKARKKKGR